MNDAVVIGGASAVLSPIIQWGHTILQSKPQVHHAVLMKSLLPIITKVIRITIVQSVCASNAMLLLMRMGLESPWRNDTLQCIPDRCMTSFQGAFATLPSFVVVWSSMSQRHYLMQCFVIH